MLGHMNLIARYDEKGEYPFEKVKPIISEILRTVISDGKEIEFNTSYHRYGLKNISAPSHVIAAGILCRVIRKITEKDIIFLRKDFEGKTAGCNRYRQI